MSQHSTADSQALLYPNKADTLTSRNIVDAYRSAYFSVHGQNPGDCYHLVGRMFVIDGLECERGWVLLEIERLRQEAIAATIDKNTVSGSRGRILQMIRKLSRI